MVISLRWDGMEDFRDFQQVLSAVRMIRSPRFSCVGASMSRFPALLFCVFEIGDQRREKITLIDHLRF